MLRRRFSARLTTFDGHVVGRMGPSVMSKAALATSAPVDADRPPDRLYWREAVARYERPSVRHSLLDLATSIVPYLVLTVAMYVSLQVSVWLSLALAIPTAGFLLCPFIRFPRRGP